MAIDKVKQVLKDLIAVLQVARIYSDQHPKFTQVLDQLYRNLNELLEDLGSFVVGIVGDELVYQKEIFFDLSRKIKKIIQYLKSKGVERLEFVEGVDKAELAKLIDFFLHPDLAAAAAPQSYLDSCLVKHIKISRMQIDTQETFDGIVSAVDYLQGYQNSLDKISDSVENILSAQPFNHQELKYTMSRVMENLLGRHQEFFKLSAIKRRDLSTFIHLLNVSILSMYFSSQIGFSSDQVLDIGMAALFHDLGKLYLSGLVRKQGVLTPDEFTQVRSHTSLGAQILMRYVKDLGMLPCVVAFEHHMRYDLKGYPKARYPKNPHKISLLISICDVYDALIERRSYKRDYPPLMVYEIMMKERGGLFDPVLLDEFFKIMGIWAVGTIVELSDGRIALVRRQNRDDIFSPVVEVVETTEQERFVDLTAVDLKIKRFLNPLAEGEKYLTYL